MAAMVVDPAGTLSAVQTITTLPDGYTARNTCSQIHLTSSRQFLYVANRGHNSIAGFAVDPATGRLTAIGRVPTEAVPSAFGLDPAGRFVFAAGSASGRLASYRINQETGALTPLTTYAVGQRPMAVLVARPATRVLRDTCLCAEPSRELLLDARPRVFLLQALYIGRDVERPDRG
jgi:6-phosphogluconolactonase (cycloisomerase 2 family)